MKKLVVVLGPTAIGKTAFSIELAKSLQTEIISCDSRQFFKELNIGVARPNDEELNAVPHHFIAHQSIQNLYSAGAFEKDALSLLKNLCLFLLAFFSFFCSVGRKVLFFYGAVAY